jgi:imidazolonepropionase-like amidohydrolase
MLLVLSLVAILHAQQQSQLPLLPSDIPKDAVIRMFLTDGFPAGQDAVWRTPDGAIHEFFQFNDRGRGPKIYTTYRLQANGLIASEESKGVDYMKNVVEERFSLVDGKAVWKNQAEDERLSDAAGKFYVDLSGGPEAGTILARALLDPQRNGKLAVLPTGEAGIRKLQALPVSSACGKETVTLYEMTGLSFTPVYIWLDSRQQLFAAVSGWSTIVQEGFESSAPVLLASRQKIENARAADLARELTHKPAGDLVIRNVSVFDSGNKSVLRNRRVTVRGNRIVSVEADDETPAASSATVIDGEDKMLLPGLWDMHAHLYEENAFLDVACGVTTVRDLGNPINHLAKLRHDIDAGAQIGPRVVPAGLIDSPSPYQAPIKVFASTPGEAIQRVDRYADLGYVQIKIYSSVKPELVPVIIREAHKRGLRVSGHVPSGMIAEQFVRDGADKIQHMNFIFLNFMPDVTETRTPARFIEPGKRAAALDLNSRQVNALIALLKEHHTVIDPTMSIWESTYVSRPGQVPKVDAPMFDRLPPQVQRQIKMAGDALPVPDAATARLYRASYENMVHMVKKLYDNGIQIVAGTDQESGYAFHRELEIYVQAGIPAPEVLRMATLEAPTVMHMEKDFGSITPGKFADLILVDGEPTANISDIRRIDLVVKNGEMYRPSEMYPAFGIRPN